MACTITAPVTSLEHGVPLAIRFVLLLTLCGAVSRPSGAQVRPAPENAPSTPALERLLADQGRIDRVATGFTFAEGPVWRQDGSLLFTDVTRAQVLRWREGSVLVWREESGGAYGMAMDREGRLIAAQHSARRVSRFEPGGGVTVLAKSSAARPLNGPADVAVAPDGSVYFTDPAPVRGARAAPSGVYRVTPDGTLVQVADDAGYPNGIEVSPDGETLYVSDGLAKTLRAYPLSADGVGQGRVLASIESWKQGVLGVPDGLALDAEGRIYLAGPGGIWVLDANGGRLGVIATPETPSNCAFGGADMRTLYITARTSIYRVRMNVAGGS